MSDQQVASSPQLPNLDSVADGRAYFRHSLIDWLSRTLLVVGNALSLASVFTPWIVVYKLDPTLPIPRRGYGPWAAVQSWQVSLPGVVAGFYMVLVLAQLFATLVVVMTPRAQRGVAYMVAFAPALGLTLVLLAIEIIPNGLELTYPYYDCNVTYGGGVAAVGFLAVLLGLATVRTRRP